MSCCGLCCSIYEAPPTAELEPLVEGKIAQTDEVSKFIHEFVMCHC